MSTKVARRFDRDLYWNFNYRGFDLYGNTTGTKYLAVSRACVDGEVTQFEGPSWESMTDAVDEFWSE